MGTSGVVRAVGTNKVAVLNGLWAMLVLMAFAVPFLHLGGRHSMDPEPRVAFAGVLLTVVISHGLMWLSVRGRSARSRLRGRVLAGVAVVLMVASNFALAAAPAAGAGDDAFNKQSQALQAKYGAAFDALGRRFRASDISLALTPEGVTTREGLAAGHRLVETYRGLLDERKKLLAEQHGEVDKLFKSKGVSPDVRRAAELIFLDGRDRLDKMNVDLDYAQRDMADAMTNLLGWFDKEVGRVGVKNGKVIYFLAEQKATVDPLFEKLQYAEGRQKAVLMAAAKEQALAEAIDAPKPGESAASAPRGQRQQGKKKQPAAPKATG